MYLLQYTKNMEWPYPGIVKTRVVVCADTAAEAISFVRQEKGLEIDSVIVLKHIQKGEIVYLL